MDKLSLLNRIKEIYLENRNVIKYLKELSGTNYNSIEDILISYDFQAGTYIDSYKNDPMIQDQYCYSLSKIIYELCECNSILEVGVGEATTLGNVLLSLKNKPNRCYGFDISWSRIKYARKFLNELNLIQEKILKEFIFKITNSLFIIKN